MIFASGDAGFLDAKSLKRRLKTRNLIDPADISSGRLRDLNERTARRTAAVSFRIPGLAKSPGPDERWTIAHR